jgi:hypothetical protein
MREDRGRCPHGRPRSCLSRHGERDDLVGTPICPDCYDHEGAVLFNANAGELWRRVTIYSRRNLAYLLGRPERELKEEVRLSYLKVAELQRRGIVHLHAIVRADACGDEVLPPPGRDLHLGSLQGDPSSSRGCLRGGGDTGGHPAPGLRRAGPGRPPHGGQVKGVASYLAKYLTKEASGTGALDHRLREGELEYLYLPEHLRRIVKTARRLGAEPGQCRLRRFAHTLGYTGHLITKSRRYSTTFLALRERRHLWRQREARDAANPSEKNNSWTFTGAGYRHSIDAVLARTYREGRLTSRREGWLALRHEAGEAA